MWRASGSASETSRSGITRLSKSRCAVCASRLVAATVSSGSPTSRPSRPSPARRPFGPPGVAGHRLEAVAALSQLDCSVRKDRKPNSLSVMPLLRPVRIRRSAALDSLTRGELVAYCAGIIDGEGCISIQRHSRGKTRGIPRPVLIVVQKQPAALDRLIEVFGGERRPVRRGDRPIAFWRWYLYGDDAIQALRDMHPYLEEKWEQAELAVEYHSRLERGWHRGNPVPDEVIQAHNEMAENLARLKRPASSEPLWQVPHVGESLPRNELVAYCAAIIDGEGCITIQPRRSAKTQGIPRLVLIVVQKQPAALDRLIEVPGGTRHIVRRNNRTSFYWRWYRYGDSAMQALREMYPYLGEKREQAELAIEYQSTYGHGWHRGNPVPDEVIHAGNEMADKLSQLKRLSSSRGGLEA